MYVSEFLDMRVAYKYIYVELLHVYRILYVNNVYFVDEAWAQQQTTVTAKSVP